MGFSVKARSQYTPRSSSGQFIATRVAPGAANGANLGAKFMLEYAQGIVHVRSGELRDSGHVVEATDNGKSATAMVVFDADHAAYAEFGTGVRGSSSPDAGKGPYNEDWPGMDPIPYLRPAADATREEVKNSMASELSISVRG